VGATIVQLSRVPSAKQKMNGRWPDSITAGWLGKGQ